MQLRKQILGAMGGLAIAATAALADEPRPLNLGFEPTPATSASSNQQMAQEVARSISHAVAGRGYNVDIEFAQGIATLRGTVSNAEQLTQMVAAAERTAGVRRVIPSLSLRGNSSVQPVSLQQGSEEMVSPPMSGGVIVDAAPGMTVQQSLAPAAPQHVFAGAQVDMPFLPPYAWPSSAPYPNYSAVQYPRCYPGEAWPYIGPFHPYPEPPLDWRKVTLKWDDGHWYLNFGAHCHHHRFYH